MVCQRDDVRMEENRWMFEIKDRFSAGVIFHMAQPEARIGTTGCLSSLLNVKPASYTSWTHNIKHRWVAYLIEYISAAVHRAQEPYYPVQESGRALRRGTRQSAVGASGGAPIATCTAV